MRSSLLFILILSRFINYAQPSCSLDNTYVFVLDVKFLDAYKSTNTTFTLVDGDNTPLYHYDIIQDIPLRIEPSGPLEFWKNQPTKKSNKLKFGFQNTYLENLPKGLYIAIFDADMRQKPTINATQYQVRIETHVDGKRKEQLVFLPKEKAIHACSNKLFSKPDKHEDIVQLNGSKMEPIKIEVGNFAQTKPSDQLEKVFIQYIFDDEYDDFNRPITRAIEKIVVRDASNYTVVQEITPMESARFYEHQQDRYLFRFNQVPLAKNPFPPICIPKAIGKHLQRDKHFFDLYEFNVDSNKYIYNKPISQKQNAYWDVDYGVFRSFGYELVGNDYFWKEWRFIEDNWKEINAEKAYWLTEIYGPKKTDLSCYRWSHGTYHLMPVFEFDGPSQYYFFHKTFPFDSICNRPWELKLRTTDQKIVAKQIGKNQKALELRDSTWLFENRIHAYKTAAFHSVEKQIEQPFWIEYFAASATTAVLDDKGNTIAFEEHKGPNRVLRIDVDQNNYPTAKGVYHVQTKKKIGKWSYWKDRSSAPFDSIHLATLHVYLSDFSADSIIVTAKKDSNWFRPAYTTNSSGLEVFLPLNTDSIKIQSRNRFANYSFLRTPLKVNTSLQLNLIGSEEDYLISSGIATLIQYAKDRWVINWNWKYFASQDHEKQFEETLKELRSKHNTFEFEVEEYHKVLIKKERADYDELIQITEHPAVSSLCKLTYYANQHTYYNNEIWIDFIDGYAEMNSEFIEKHLKFIKSAHQEGYMQPLEKYHYAIPVLDEQLIRALNALVSSGLAHDYALNWHLKVELDE